MNPPSRSRRVAIRLLAGFVGVFALCGALELALVLADFRWDTTTSPLVVRIPDGTTDGGHIHEKDLESIWHPVPGAALPWGVGETINSAGYRGPLRTLERRPGTLRIATMGDSSTFGYGVAYAECYSARLEAILAERLGRPVEVLDAGVIGSTVRQGLGRWRSFVRAYRPDVVVAAYGAVVEHAPAMGASDDELIRTQVVAASAFHQWTTRLRRDLRLAHLTAWVADTLRGGSLEIEKRRWQRELLVQSQLDTVGKVDWTGARRVSPEDFARYLLELRDEVRATGARFVAMSMPRRMIVEQQRPVVLEYTRRLADLAARGEIDLVDARAAFGAALRPGMTPRDLLVDDFHPSPAGHEIIANALAEAIVAGLER